MNKREVGQMLILSSDRLLSRFFEIEAERLGFRVDICDKPISDASHADAVVIDRATVRRMPSHLPSITLYIGQSEELADAKGTYSVSWPLPIGQLRDVLEEIKARIGFALAGTPTTNSAQVTAECHKSDAETKNLICFLDDNVRIVAYNGRNIELSANEEKVLRLLWQRRNELVLREEILNLLGATSGNMADVYIHRLRKKIEDPQGPRLIFAVRGQGYRLSIDMERI